MSVQLNNVIISDVKNFLNIPSDSTAFDNEIFPFTMGALGELEQVSRILSVPLNETTTWIDLISTDESLDLINPFMSLVPIFVMMRVKVLFDPPPPSNVKFYDDRTEMLLWRVKTLYETILIPELVPVPEPEPPPEEIVEDENISEGDVVSEN